MLFQNENDISCASMMSDHNLVVRRASIVLSILGVVLPLGFAAMGAAKPETPETHQSLLIPTVMLVVCALTLLSALNCYLADLRYYSRNSIEQDSGIEMHVRVPGIASGRRRLLLYHPLLIFTASFGIGISFVIIISN